MSPGATDPATPLSGAPYSAGVQAQPDNLLASPSCRFIVGNSNAEAQFELSGNETLHAANEVVSPTSVDHPVIMANEQDVSISSLAYFSNSKLIALSRRIGTTQVADLLAKIEAAVKSTTQSPVGVTPYPSELEKEARSISLSQQSRLDYIESYFDQVHPLYPFLDRATFETRASSSHVSDNRSVDPAWCALYHAVLGVGSLYHECGSFSAFSGAAWDIFQISLALLPRIIFGQRNLVTIQAIFGVTYAALPIEGILITEAARLVSYFQMNKAEACQADPEFQKTFWVIYSLESEYCLNTGRSSTIPSHDISCPIPQTTFPFLSGFNWLQCKSIHAQMASGIYQRLFSVKAKSLSQESRQMEASRCLEELETWRLSVPESLRPGPRLRSHRLGHPQAVYVAVQIHFSYYNVRIALARVCILAWAQDPEEQMRYKLILTESARSIIDLIHLIDLEPFVLPWVQYNMPQAALFVLFDFIIAHPCHDEARKNLSYMQIATSYFMRLQYATEDKVFGTVLTQFLQIATEFVQDTYAASINRPGAFENPQGSELCQSRGSGTGTSDFEESLGFQGLQFPIHNGFEFQDMDFWLTESGVLSFLESNGDFGLPNPISEGLSVRGEQGIKER
ncbi:hypothetical protein FOMG_17574 [Fusarium oxysporum f. sp. melonis 26406]|uniref:Transcription factor domain-containing protein n=1 Tax=Fusarium oxysporum f. sp. melonis 26406 TaxID=1089452 RepID=W9ZC09_FUSOX|nr:hypothetical protein FOMG_17574 [Fusarium oxysporum f. sp. melonis 26406]